MEKHKLWSPDGALACISLVATVGLIGWLAWYCRYGFDFSDEGFYLNWLQRPFNYTVSSSQFGFIYHPLYQLLGGSIAALRMANILLSIGLSLIGAWQLISYATNREGHSLPFRNKLSIAAALATSGILPLIFAGMWLPTPSYNTLAFQGILVTSIGLFSIQQADSAGSGRTLTGWVLIGLGGWLVLMAKPTSAAALAVAVTAYLVLSARLRVAPFLIGAGTSLGMVVLTAYVVDGSPAVFIERLREGARTAAILSPGYSFEQMFRLDALVLDPGTELAMTCVLAVMIVAIFVASIGGRRLHAIGGLLASLLICVGFAIISSEIPMQTLSGPFRGLLAFAVPAGAFVAALLVSGVAGLRRIRWSLLVLASLLIFLPYAYAFGTTNNYWIPISAGAIFLVYAGVVLTGMVVAPTMRPRVLMLFGISVQVVSAALISQALASPYRQPTPLFQNESIVEMGESRTRLVLAKRHAEYVSAAERTAKLHDFRPGMPLIDLSGHSPGLIYAIGGNSVGMPWAIGGYPASAEYAISSLRHVSCDLLARAWLLEEPNGARKLPPDVLASFGANAEADWQTVGSFAGPDGQIQYLQKPIRDAEAARVACEQTRSKGT